MRLGKNGSAGCLSPSLLSAVRAPPFPASASHVRRDLVHSPTNLLAAAPPFCGCHLALGLKNTRCVCRSADPRRGTKDSLRRLLSCASVATARVWAPANRTRRSRPQQLGIVAAAASVPGGGAATTRRASGRRYAAARARVFSSRVTTSGISAESRNTSARNADRIEVGIYTRVLILVFFFFFFKQCHWMSFVGIVFPEGPCTERRELA